MGGKKMAGMTKKLRKKAEQVRLKDVYDSGFLSYRQKKLKRSLLS